MKIKLIILSILLTVAQGYGQQIDYRNIDSLSVIAVSDTTVRLIIGTYVVNPDGSIDTVFVRKAPVLKGQAAKELFNGIWDSQNVLAAAEVELIQEPLIVNRLTRINSGIQTITGNNYFQEAWGQYGAQVVGYYEVRRNGTRVFAEVLTTQAGQGQIRQVNAQGQPVQGGLNGTFRIRSANRVELVNFITGVPSVILSRRPSEPIFRSLDRSTVLTFLRR